VVGEGALRFSHSGERYILGYGREFFGIWDRTVAGPAVLRFPRTDEGWNEAWGQFTAREPRAMPVPTGGTPPPDVRAPTGVFKDAHGLAVWVMGLLAAVGLVTLVTVVVEFILVRDLTGQIVGEEVVRTADRLQAWTWVQLVGILVTGLVWVIWQHRAQANLRALGASDVKYSPGWAVGWWFVPFANFVMPYNTMTELWKASGPHQGTAWRMQPTTRLLPFWWGTWLLAAVISRAAAAIATDATGATDLQRMIQELTTSVRWSLAGDLVLVVSAALAILLVRDIDRRQADRRRLAAGGPQPFAV
jgi:hypothetical protein